MNDKRINYLKHVLLNLEYNKNNIESQLIMINNNIDLINDWLKEITDEDTYKAIQEFVKPSEHGKRNGDE